MVIGVNWKAVWDPVWKVVWDQTAGGPVVPPNLHRLFLDLDTGAIIWRMSA